MNLFFASDPLEPQDTDPEKRGKNPTQKLYFLSVTACVYQLRQQPDNIKEELNFKCVNDT